MLDNPSHKISSDQVHKTVYVADLPKDISISTIAEYFESRIKAKSQIIIKRPIFSRFYFAYVVFDTIEAAQKTLKEYKFPHFLNSPVMSRVLPYTSNRKADQTSVQNNTVFVKGFEEAKWDHETLYARFCQFGPIQDCKVAIDDSLNYLGFGKVQFSKMEDAQKAIQEMNNFDFSAECKEKGEHKLSVTEFHPKVREESRPFNNLYVSGFGAVPDFTKEDLTRLFEHFGELLSVSVSMDENGRHRGYGYVCFKDTSEAMVALDRVNQQYFIHHKAEFDESDKRPKMRKPREMRTGEDIDFDSEVEVKGVRLRDLKANQFFDKKARESRKAYNLYKYRKSMQNFSLFVRGIPGGTSEEEFRQFIMAGLDPNDTTIKDLKFKQLADDTATAYIYYEKTENATRTLSYIKNTTFKGTPLLATFTSPKETRFVEAAEKSDKRERERRLNLEVAGGSLQGVAGNVIALVSSLLQTSIQSTFEHQRRSMSAPRNQGGNNGQSDRYIRQGSARNGGMRNNSHMGPRMPFQNQLQQHAAPMQIASQDPVPLQMQGGMSQQQFQAAGNPNVQLNQEQTFQLHQQMQRSVNYPMPQPQMYGQFPHQQHPSSAPGAESQAGQSTFSSRVDRSYQLSFMDESMRLFSQPTFGDQPMNQKKMMIGNMIFKHVAKLIGETKAPKVTGMILELPMAELNLTVREWEIFETKVFSAVDIIDKNEPSEAPADSRPKGQE